MTNTKPKLNKIDEFTKGYWDGICSYALDHYSNKKHSKTFTYGQLIGMMDAPLKGLTPGCWLPDRLKS